MPCLNPIVLQNAAETILLLQKCVLFVHVGKGEKKTKETVKKK